MSTFGVIFSLLVFAGVTALVVWAIRRTLSEPARPSQARRGNRKR